MRQKRKELIGSTCTEKSKLKRLILTSMENIAMFIKSWSFMLQTGNIYNNFQESPQKKQISRFSKTAKVNI